MIIILFVKRSSPLFSINGLFACSFSCKPPPASSSNSHPPPPHPPPPPPPPPGLPIWLPKYAIHVQGGALEWLASALQPSLQDVCQRLPPRSQCQGTHTGFLRGVGQGRGCASASGAHVPAEEEGKGFGVRLLLSHEPCLVMLPDCCSESQEEWWQAGLNCCHGGQ